MIAISMGSPFNKINGYKMIMNHDNHNLIKLTQILGPKDQWNGNRNNFWLFLDLDYNLVREAKYFAIHIFQLTHKQEPENSSGSKTLCKVIQFTLVIKFMSANILKKKKTKKHQCKII